MVEPRDRAEDGAGLLRKHMREPAPRLPAPLVRGQPLINRRMAQRPEERIAGWAQALDAHDRLLAA